MRCAGHVARVGERINVDKVLVRTPEGKRPLRTPQSKRDHSVKMSLGGVRWGVIDRTDMAQERLPSDFIEFWELLASQGGLCCTEMAGCKPGSMWLLTKMSLTW